MAKVSCALTSVCWRGRGMIRPSIRVASVQPRASSSSRQPPPCCPGPKPNTSRIDDSCGLLVFLFQPELRHFDADHTRIVAMLPLGEDALSNRMEQILKDRWEQGRTCCRHEQGGRTDP